MFVSFCDSTQLLFSRLEKVSKTRYTEERNVCMAYTNMVFDGCWKIWESDSILSGSHTGESVLALQVKMWKRERVFEDEVSIENTCLGVGSKKRGMKFKWGRSFKHWLRGSPGQWFPGTGCLCVPAIFVSGTSGIPPILNYRSLSPIIPYIVISW